MRWNSIVVYSTRWASNMLPVANSTAVSATGLGDEGDGRLVDLGRGLDYADDHAYHQHRQQDRAGQPQDGDQATTQFGQGNFGTHGQGNARPVPVSPPVARR